MLVRPSQCHPEPVEGRGFEIFMLRRSGASHFVPDAYVFPGGTLTENDLSERAFARTRGIDASAIARQFRAAPGLGVVPLPSPHEAAGLMIAALRELFEEAGVLLACDATGTPAVVRSPEPRTDFFEVLESQHLYADARALMFFSQWLTPPQFPKRYNTHFFLARAPENENAAADAFETYDGIWLEPRAALARNGAGELSLVYPTIKHLQRLAQFESADRLFAFARSKPILAVTPNSVDNGFALPADLENAW